MPNATLIPLALLLATAPPTRATEGPPPQEFGALRAVLGGNPDLAGFSVSITAIPHLEIEAGWSLAKIQLRLWGDGLAHDSTFFARAGPRLTLLSSREAGQSGVTLEAAVLAGVRSYLEHQYSASTSGEVGGTSRRTQQTLVAFNLVAAIECTFWWSAHLGLQVQLALGGNFWTAGAPETDSYYNAGWTRHLDARFAVGLAF